MTTNENLAYFAGLFDGEGSVSVSRNKTKFNSIGYHSKLSIGNTDKCIIDWVIENYGGYMFTVHRNGRNDDRWKDIYVWWKNMNKDDIPLVDSLIKYSIIKKERLILLRKFIETRGTTGKIVRVTPEIANIRDEIFYKMKILNKRGTTKNNDIETDVVDSNRLSSTNA